MAESKISEKRWEMSFEPDIYKKWKKDKIYGFDKGSKKKVYSIDTPPPYVNSPIHMGHATTYVLMDMFARYKRMKGFNVLFPLGLDRNGLPIEMAAEKKFGVKLTETKREDFIEYCRKILAESSDISTESFLRLGISFNSWELGTDIGDVYHTDSDDYRTLTQNTFIDLWKKGLIYEDKRINNWCPGCQTTIADCEIEYKDISTFFNDIRFTVKETGEEIVIGTTRPELVCSCGMVIFNPEDKRYKHLDGKTAITPVFGKEVPIKAHPSAEIEKGTGLVMMCSAGDTTDIRFFREMKLKPVISIDRDGTMNENAGFLSGLKVRDARLKMVEKLKEEGLHVGAKRTTHRTPVCERSKDEVEFIEMSELYLKQVDFKKDMVKIAKKLNFYSENSRKILLDWIDGVSIDWPISRRRYYATPIPLWYCDKCGEVIVPEKGKLYNPWKEKCPVGKCPKCGASDFKGDERVFDTWFDSSNSPLYVLKYSKDDAFFKKSMPCSLRPQGKEIVRTWLYYTLLKGYLLLDRPIFEDVFVHFHILDDKGIKMSKSLGNVLDPREILDKYGAEPFRLWAAVEGNLDRTDFRCSYDRIDGAGKTLAKLWNVSRFISMFDAGSGKAELNDLDRWIRSEVSRLVKLADREYAEYNFHKPMVEIKHFIWETFSSHYLELVKNRAYNSEGKFSLEEQRGAVSTLNYCLETVLKVVSPVIPFLSYKVYMELKGEDVHGLEFPSAEKAGKTVLGTDDIAALNGAVWKAKKDAGLSLKSEVSEVVMPSIFKGVEKEIMLTHNVKKIKYGKVVGVKV